MSEPFWRTKRLDQMSRAEWESLCDGCGRCCLVKLLDEDSDETHYTDVACRLLDTRTCRCKDYPRRQTLVPDCVALTAEKLSELTWMPSTCAYRLLHEGRDLPWWHPLVSGDPGTVIDAGISVAGQVVSERRVREEDLVDHIVTWPR